MATNGPGAGRLLVLGDAHADEADHRRALLAAYDAVDAPAALQTGDLAHYDLPRPTWFVGGNHEDHDVIVALRAGDSPPGATNVHLLGPAVTTVGGIRVAGLSGTYAPTWFDESLVDRDVVGTESTPPLTPTMAASRRPDT
jgi:hypothetical protein